MAELNRDTVEIQIGNYYLEIYIHMYILNLIRESEIGGKRRRYRDIHRVIER